MCSQRYNTEGFLCGECLGKIDETKYGEQLVCYVCGAFLAQKEVTYISDEGFVFCADCDDDYTCTGCNRKFKYPGIVYENEYEQLCTECYEEILVSQCAGCEKDILRHDDYKKVKGIAYCIDCYKNLAVGKCEACGKKIKYDDVYYGDDGYYCCRTCYVGLCKICDTILMGDNYKKISGRYYCYDCYGGTGYLGECSDCGDKVFGNDKYTLTDNKYYCYECAGSKKVKCGYCGESVKAEEDYSVEGIRCCKACYNEYK